jgi:hypothetical protein
MTRIVTSTYRYKRPPKKRKAVALEVPAIVKAKSGRRQVRKTAAESEESASTRWRGTRSLAQPTANDDRPVARTSVNDPPRSAIVTIRRRGKRFGDVPDMTPEEHKRRGDGADAMFQEMKRQIAAAKERP